MVPELQRKYLKSCQKQWMNYMLNSEGNKVINGGEIKKITTKFNSKFLKSKNPSVLEKKMAWNSWKRREWASIFKRRFKVGSKKSEKKNKATVSDIIINEQMKYGGQTLIKWGIHITKYYIHKKYQLLEKIS